MKGAFKGEIVSESVGLKSKMYFSVSVDGKKIKKTKGSMKILLKTQDIKNLRMFCLMKINKIQNEKNSK